MTTSFASAVCAEKANTNADATMGVVFNIFIDLSMLSVFVL
jgi:hypothetical protein